MNKTAALFSGQGSQKPGMGAALAGELWADEVFEAASDVCGFDVRATCSDEAALRDARRVQPALCAVSIAAFRALEHAGVKPDFVAGFSLGQIAALAGAGMLSLEHTFELLNVRSAAMAEAAAERPGAMCALMGGERADVEALCESAAQGDVLVPANFNAPGQVVVSGDRAAVERAAAAWAGLGRRATMLAVAGAFHSPLMASAARKVAAYLEGIRFEEPRVPLVCNLDARPLCAADAPRHLARQIESPVRFEESIAWLSEQGVRTYAECGSGKVLCGLVRRIDKTASRCAISSLEDAAAVAKECGAQAPGEERL